MLELLISLQIALKNLSITLDAYANYETPQEIIMATTTAYASLEELTDSTPFITASGTTTRKGIVANNCLKFGTKIIIDQIIYEVQDRMNKRYGCNYYDLWFENKNDALQYGVQRKQIKIL